MDVADIVGMSERAREFKRQSGPRIYTMRTPTEHEMRVTYQRTMKDPAGSLLFQRELTVSAVVNWSGVTLQDILPEQPPAELPFDKKLVPTLFDALDARDEKDYQMLAEAVLEQYSKRKTVLEEDSKN